MIKTLPITSHHLAICEGNFLRLKKLLNKFKETRYEFEAINPDLSSSAISLLYKSFEDFKVCHPSNIAYNIGDKES